MMKWIAVALLVLVVQCRSAEEQATNIEMIPSPAGTDSAEPFLFTSPEGNVFLSWVSRDDSRAALMFSEYHNGSWSPAVMIDSGSQWFVNWADYPMIAASKEKLIAHYLKKSGEGTYAYDIKTVASSDNGKTWDKAITLNGDGKQAEHGFVSMLPVKDGFFACWLDGRNSVMEGEHHEGHQGQMTLRGAMLDYSGTKRDEWELDDRTCDCCQTSAALTDNGPVVVYRDRSPEEIRDIFIVRWKDGQWTRPVAVWNDNWKITGCPVNGPRIAANGNDLAVVWFSAPDSQSQVKLSFSGNGGITFATPVRVDNGSTIGRVDVEWIGPEKVLVTWMDGQQIRGTVFTKSGERVKDFIAGSSSESRSAGFPQITVGHQEVLFAWSDEKAKEIRMAKVPLSDF